MSWLYFALAFVAFLLTHAIPLRPDIKAYLQGLAGERGFTIGYSLLSLVMLGLLISAARHAPVVIVWQQAAWQRYAVLAGMFLVCLTAALAIGRPNPFSFGGGKAHRFDPAHPGIVRLSRHPLLLALAGWAGLHLLPNGDLAHVIMFGVFAVFALLGGSLIDRRKQRQMGPDAWHALRHQTGRAGWFDRPSTWKPVFYRCLWAIGAFMLLIALHEPVIGAAPLPV